MSDLKPPSYDRIILYFILTIGIIAIFVWSIFFVELLQVNDKMLQTLSIANSTKIELDRKAQVADIIDILTNDTHDTVDKMNKVIVNYIRSQGANTEEFFNKQDQTLDLIKDVQKDGKITLELVLQISQINKKNIENILGNLTELNKKLNSTIILLE